MKKTCECIKEPLDNFSGEHTCKICLDKKKAVERTRVWRENNPIKYKDQAKKWTTNNKENEKERLKQRYQSNIENYKKSHKKYYEDNKENIKKINKKWVENNPEKVKIYKNKWDKVNPEKVAWRRILKRVLKQFGKEKEANTIDILGYSALDLHNHMISLFTEGMSWSNYGEWHIDHKKSVSKYPKDTHPSVVNALSNLQPLWATTREINGIMYEGNLNKNKY